MLLIVLPFNGLANFVHSVQLILIFIFKDSFIFAFWLWWISVAAHALSVAVGSGSERCAGSRGGFSCCMAAQAQGAQASVPAPCELSGGGAGAWLLRGTWDLPGPGIRLAYLIALQGGFSTTGSPGKPGSWFLISILVFFIFRHFFFGNLLDHFLIWTFKN